MRTTSVLIIAILGVAIVGCGGGAGLPGQTGSAVQPASVRPTEVLPANGQQYLGDMDGDGEASVGDAIKILRIVVGLDDADPYADANQSGTTDVGDAIKVLRCVVGLEPWPIGGGPQMVNLCEYYPLNEGDQWYYRGAEANGDPLHFLQEAAEQVQIGGRPACRLRASGQTWGSTANYGWCDSTGYWHFGYDASNGDEYRLDPPAALPAEVEIARSYTFPGRLLVNGQDVGPYSGSFRVEALEGITVAAGHFADCIRIHTEVHLGGDTDISREWWARDVGEVKKENIEQAARWELIWANVGGTAYEAAVFDLQEYCPLGTVGEVWTYRDCNTQEEMQMSNVGTAVICGVTCMKSEHGTGAYDYVAWTAQGLAIMRTDFEYGYDLYDCSAPQIQLPATLRMGETKIFPFQAVFHPTQGEVHSHSGSSAHTLEAVEAITVPAGSFVTLRIHEITTGDGEFGDDYVWWYALDTGPVKIQGSHTEHGVLQYTFDIELVSISLP